MAEFSYRYRNSTRVMALPYRYVYVQGPGAHLVHSKRVLYGAAQRQMGHDQRAPKVTQSTTTQRTQR